MADITATVVMVFNVTPNPKVDQPGQTSEALDRATNSCIVKPQEGVSLTLVTVGTSSTVPKG